MTHHLTPGKDAPRNGGAARPYPLDGNFQSICGYSATGGMVHVRDPFTLVLAFARGLR
jgi:hypothetical protein